MSAPTTLRGRRGPAGGILGGPGAQWECGGRPSCRRGPPDRNLRLAV